MPFAPSDRESTQGVICGGVEGGGGGGDWHIINLKKKIKTNNLPET